MHEDVRRYLAAEEARQGAYRKANEDYHAACRDARIALAKAKLEIAQESGWGSLTQSSDPLIRWIAQNCENHKEHATEILKALPAPLSTLQEIAGEGGWCGEWDRLVDRAVRDGVIADDRTPELRELEIWVRRQIGPSEAFTQRLRAALQAEREAGRAEAQADNS